MISQSSETGTPPAAPRAGRLNGWLIAVLALSLALNAFVLGAVVGERWRGESRDVEVAPAEGRGVPPGIVPDSIRQFGRMLGPEARAKLRRAARPQLRELRGRVRETAAARLDVLHALSAPEFDAEALKDAFARVRKAEAAMTEVAHQVLAEAAASLTEEERAAISAALEERVARWRARAERRRDRWQRFQERWQQE